MLKWVLVLTTTLHSSFAALHILLSIASLHPHFARTVPPSRRFFDGNGDWLPHSRPMGVTVESCTAGWSGTMDRQCCSLLCIDISP
jgi:hypothetical protein